MLDKNIQKIVETEKKLAEYQGDDRIMEGSVLREELKKQFDKVKFVKSGFPTFDFLTKGFYTGELICITGRPKRGKTSYCRTLTKNFISQGIKSLWFPFDVPLFIFLNSFGTNPPAYYLPRQLKQEAMNWINARIWEAKIKYHIKAVFIDDLGYLVDLVHSQRPSLELGTICRQLKRLAIEQNVMIFITHHSKRIERSRTPTEEDLRDSSLIAGIVDKVITIMRKQGKSGKSIPEGKVIINVDRFAGVLQESIPIIFKDNFYSEISNLEPPQENEKEEINPDKISF